MQTHRPVFCLQVRWSPLLKVMYMWSIDNIQHSHRVTHCEHQQSVCSVWARRRHIRQTASFIKPCSPAACGRQCAQQHTHARQGRTGSKNTLTGTAWSRRASRSAGGARTKHSGICPAPLEEVNTQRKLACCSHTPPPLLTEQFSWKHLAFPVQDVK